MFVGDTSRFPPNPFLERFKDYHERLDHLDLLVLLDEIVADSTGDDQIGTDLIRKYPDLKEAWVLYSRVSNLHLKYTHHSEITKFPRVLRHLKKAKRYKIKVAYLERHGMVI